MLFLELSKMKNHDRSMIIKMFHCTLRIIIYFSNSDIPDFVFDLLHRYIKNNITKPLRFQSIENMLKVAICR